jgi:hypothetical protein
MSRLDVWTTQPPTIWDKEDWLWSWPLASMPRLDTHWAIPPLPLMTWKHDVQLSIGYTLHHGTKLATDTTLLTQKLTTQNRVLLGMLIITQLVKKCPIFYGTQILITMFTKAHQWPLSRVTRMQSTPSQPTSVRPILILSSHLHPCLLNSLFPSSFPAKI